MATDQIDFVVKGAMIGDFGVGKSSIFQRYMTGEAVQHPTIGVDFHSIVHHIDQHTIRFHLWDTAGQERFRSIVQVYVRNVFLFFLVIDVTQRKSFERIQEWLTFIKTNNRESTTDNTIVVLLVNKVDKPKSEWTFTKTDIEQDIAQHKNINDVYYVSCKPDSSVESVKDIFSSTLELVYATLKQNHYRLKGVVDRRTDRDERYALSTPPGSPIQTCNLPSSKDIMINLGFKNSTDTDTCPRVNNVGNMCSC